MIDRSVLAGRKLARSALVARARDLTDEAAQRACVVVAPHPDDETLGCGALIARKAAAGTPVTVVVASNGSNSHRSDTITPDELGRIRRNEVTRAVETLGREVHLVFLDLPDGELSGHRAEITGRVAEIIRRSGTCDVYSPSVAEPPPDHSGVGLAVRQAWRLAGQPAAGSTPTPGRGMLLEYPVWLWSRWPLGPDKTLQGRLRHPLAAIFREPVIKVSTAGFLQTKSRALAEHVTQTTHFRADRHWQPLPEELMRSSLGPYELFFPISG